jgi:hypothetical protein
MRAPAQHRRPGLTPGTAWTHPYTGIQGLATFYNDGGNPSAGDPTPTTAPKPGPPPNTAPAPQFTQEDLDRIAAKEKAQGLRAGARQALEDLAKEMGFTSPDDVKTFVEAARKAQQDALSEDERRRQELEQREQQLAAREAAAAERERVANRRAILASLGATGVDLEDAAALLRAPDDADDQALREAAEALKGRRPELFGQKPAQQPNPLPPAPGGAPASGTPNRGPGEKIGSRGLEMARLRGHVKDAA